MLGPATITKTQQKWINALRSGEYKQVRNSLRTPDGFCVLGVACDVSNLGEWDEHGNYRTESYDAAQEPWLNVPQEVYHALSLDEHNFFDRHFLSALTHANDNGIHFDEMADKIKIYLVNRS